MISEIDTSSIQSCREDIFRINPRYLALRSCGKYIVEILGCDTSQELREIILRLRTKPGSVRTGKYRPPDTVN